MDQSFGKKEKLKSKSLIDNLFSEGKSVSKFPLKLVYAPISNSTIINHKVGVSVPKRHFKKAVDRNYLKRIMREGFRKNKYLVANNLHPFSMMFIYTGKDKCDARRMFSLTETVLKKFIEKEQNMKP
ncbi:MAG TPA: ribonuclease P protein component [Salinimicrobium sp.]|nr:ribonuclease P protein component [Salinimicrobium sp.]